MSIRNARLGAVCFVLVACSPHDRTYEGPAPAQGGAAGEASGGTGGDQDGSVGGSGGTSSGGSSGAGGTSAGGTGGTGGTSGTGGAPQGCVNVSSGIAAAEKFACVARNDGAAFCWGYNWTGELGNGQGATGAKEIVPDQVVGVANVQSVTNGMATVGAGNPEGHGCALQLGGTVACWGSNRYGQVGNGTTVSVWTTAKPVSGLTGAKQVSAGGAHTCAVKTDNSVWCWGLNDHGQLGLGQSGTGSDAPAQVTTLPNVEQVSAGTFHTCARTSDGAAWCWGWNEEGMIGDGSTNDRSAPVKVLPDGVAWISAGTSTTCAVRSGKAWCWGWNLHGELGSTTNLGSDTPNATPTEVQGISNVAEVIATDGYTWARRSDGTIWYWGGPSLDYEPQQTTLPSAERVGASFNIFCSTRSDGTAWCQGDNTYGQLGNGKTQDSTTPQKVLLPCP